MTHKENLAGRRFGDLEVIELAGRNSSGQRLWNCLCKCGNHRLVRVHDLKSGKIFTCAKCGYARAHKTVGQSDAAYMVVYKRNAQIRGLEFSLSSEEFSNIINTNCHYCGAPARNGVDRMDPLIGYTLDNCVPCCIKCNKAKSNQSYQEFVDWIDRIIKFHTGS